MMRVYKNTHKFPTNEIRKQTEKSAEKVENKIKNTLSN